MSDTGQKMLLYLSRNINGFLESRGCTQSEAAEGAGLNLSTLNNWACQKAYPRWKNLIKLADYLGCPIYELVEDPERRDRKQRYLTQWQRTLLQKDKDSPEAHSIFQELCSPDNRLDEEALTRLLAYIKAIPASPQTEGTPENE